MNKYSGGFYILQGWFSPGQVFILDEYCARYGVRGCYRHLQYLAELLSRAEQGSMIDPTLIHYSFAFCASHVHGNRYYRCYSLMIKSIFHKRWIYFLYSKNSFDWLPLGHGNYVLVNLMSMPHMLEKNNDAGFKCL